MKQRTMISLSGDLRALGSLDNGMPIYINRIVADADFKICVGGIYPHSSVGFTGGAKIDCPPGSQDSRQYFTFIPTHQAAVQQLLKGKKAMNPTDALVLNWQQKFSDLMLL